MTAARTPESDLLREKALLALGQLPAFSPILSKLLATLAGEDISVSKLADLIEKDAVVAGNVMHLVNSVLYSRRSNITSVRHAISFLGMNKLRNAVLAMSVARMWKSISTPAGWSRSRFNAHSAAGAILSDLLAQHIEVMDAEAAFVAGLLHDLGHLLLGCSLPKQYSEIRALTTSGISEEECEFEILGFTHAQLSAEALALWSLPQSIVNAVRTHHDAWSGGEITVGQVIGAADRYVNSVGLGICSDPNQQADSDPQIESDLSPLTDLGLDLGLVKAITSDFQAECDALLQFMK